jgi:3-oxo-4,17-pregnadiene-20-carboxyl-CoA hydratase beta subunit
MSKTLALGEVSVGTALPELPVPITTTMIIAGALASRDFTPLHHDKGAAQAGGMQDVFMNILTTNGLVGRYVTEWAGPDAVLRRVAIKLGAPNLPGDTMRLSGTVRAKDEEQGVVEVQIAGTNSWGDHVTGTVTVALPRTAQA